MVLQPKIQFIKQNIFSLVHELTTFLEELDDVDEDDVVSLSNVDDMIGLEDELLVEPLIETDMNRRI